jgi:hypothetical protein
MDGGISAPESLTSVGQIDSATEQNDPFDVISKINQTGVPDIAHSGNQGESTITPVAEFTQFNHTEPAVNLDAQAEANQLAMIQQMRDKIEAAKAQAQEGGENMAGVAGYEAPTDLSPADKETFEERMQNLTPKQQEELVEAPEYLAYDETELPPSSTEDSVPHLPSLIEHPVGPFAGLFKQMDENGEIPKQGEALIPTLKKSVLFPLNLAKTAVKNIWSWSRGEVDSFFNRIKNLLPKSNTPTTSSA